LTAWHVNVGGKPESTDYLRGAVDSVWKTWHIAPATSEVALILPNLLTATQRAARLREGNERRRSLALLAQAYHLAQAYLAWHGDRELVWLTADRGMAAALDADDPIAVAQRSGTRRTCYAPPVAATKRWTACVRRAA